MIVIKYYLGALAEISFINKRPDQNSTITKKNILCFFAFYRKTCFSSDSHKTDVKNITE